MLAQAAKEPFDSEDFLFEIKWDGIRCVAFIQDRKVRLQSRELVDITASFPELASLAYLLSGTILDGELVVMRDSKPSLAEIQHRAMLQDIRRIQFTSQVNPALYVVFDLLYLRRTSLMAAPLTVRRAKLERLLSQPALRNVFVPESIPTHGRALFDKVVALGLEGVMAKHKDSPYRAGKRSRAWLKIKPTFSEQGPGNLYAAAGGLRVCKDRRQTINGSI